MRKLVSILLSVLLLAALVIPAAAEETDTMFTVTASTTEVEPGGTITLTVTATDAAESCYAFGVLLECDQDVFEVTKVTAENMAGNFKYPFVWFPTAKRPEAGVGGWNIDKGNQGSPADLQKPTGDVGVIELTVKSGVEPGEYTIKSRVEFWTKDGHEIGTVNPITITVTAASALPKTGNVDGQGVVDSDDAIHLLLYTLFQDDYTLYADGDIDSSGRIDADDAIYLLLYTLFSADYPLYP